MEMAAIRKALSLGMGFVDTAEMYGNESMVGAALAEHVDDPQRRGLAHVADAGLVADAEDRDPRAPQRAGQPKPTFCRHYVCKRFFLRNFLW